MNDTIWIPVNDFAKSYNKHRTTIIRWIECGFIFSLGVTVKKDFSGYWYIGIPASKLSQHVRSL